MPAIHLVTVFGGPCDVLEDWLRYYDTLGVDDITVHVQGTSDEDVERIMSRIAASAPVLTPITAIVRVAPWTFFYNTDRFAESRQRAPHDWFLYADQDEFQRWPDDIHDVLAGCYARGEEYVEGAVLDMFAPSCRPEPRDPIPGQSIWSQYPLAQLVTGPVMGSCMGKVVACRGRVTVGHGQHQAHRARGARPEDLYVPVHHFKWTEHVAATAAARAETETANVREAHARLVAHMAATGGYVSGVWPAMVVIPDYTYPYWSNVVEARTMANYFSLHLMHQSQRRVRIPLLDLSNFGLAEKE